MLQDSADLNHPSATTENILAHYPDANAHLIDVQDMRHFLPPCQWRCQQTVPFVPALDEIFESWFKKDSLWQSEDLNAVGDQSVRRTCILQGPKAAKCSTVFKPIKDILDGIHNRHTDAPTTDFYGGGESAIPV